MARNKRHKAQSKDVVVAHADNASSGVMDVDEFLNGGFDALVHGDVARSSNAASETGTARAARPELPTSSLRGEQSSKPGRSKHAKMTTTTARSKASSPSAVKRPRADEESDSSADEGLTSVRKEAKSHKAQLAALKDADPEFYKYLAESDKSLLAFSDDDDDGDGGDDGGPGDAVAHGSPADEDDAGEGDEAHIDAQPGQDAGAAASTSGALDSAKVEAWCRGASEDASLGAIGRVMSAYRAACHLGDASEDGASSHLRIMSDTAFQNILLFTLRSADDFLRRGLALPARGPPSQAQLSTARARKGLPLVKSYLGNTLHLLAHLAEEHTSAFILRRARASVGLLPPFVPLMRKWIRLVLTLFGDATSRRVRLQALLWLRAAATELGRAGLDDVLKGAYRTYAARARLVNAASLPDLAFMAAGVVELYGLDAEASYEHMFGFVAQLAVLLRNALTAKTVDAYREVYSWRAINCLELWGRVLATHVPRLPALAPLVYPVAQLLLGAARLVPSPRWLPVRLRLLRIATSLAAATGHLIPVTPLALEILSWSELGKPARGTGACPDLSLQLRLSKANLKQPAVQQAIVEQAMEVLASSLALSASNPGFPELAHLPTIALRRFAKATKVERFRTQAKLLLDAIESNAKLVGLHRDAVDFAPKDIDAVRTFLSDMDKSSLPMVAYAQRLAARAAEKRQAVVSSHAPLRDSVAGDVDAQDAEDEDDTLDDVTDGAALMPREQAPLDQREGSHARDARMGAHAAPRLRADEDDAAVNAAEDVIEAYELSDDDDDDDDRDLDGETEHDGAALLSDDEVGGDDTDEDDPEMVGGDRARAREGLSKQGAQSHDRRRGKSGSDKKQHNGGRTQQQQQKKKRQRQQQRSDPGSAHRKRKGGHLRSGKRKKGKQ